MADTIFMAEDALALVLYGYEHALREIPLPSKRDDIVPSAGSFVNFISCDTIEYAKHLRIELPRQPRPLDRSDVTH